MAIEASPQYWLVENRVLILVSAPVLTLESLALDNDNTTRIIESAAPSDDPIHILIDAKDVKQRPSPMQAWKNLDVFKHERVQYILLYNMNSPIAMFFGRTLLRLAKREVKTFYTAQQALQFVMLHDKSLTGLFQKYQEPPQFIDLDSLPEIKG